jgi:hypothetical protein
MKIKSQKNKIPCSAHIVLAEIRGKNRSTKMHRGLPKRIKAIVDALAKRKLQEGEKIKLCIGLGEQLRIFLGPIPTDEGEEAF